MITAEVPATVSHGFSWSTPGFAVRIQPIWWKNCDGSLTEAADRLHSCWRSRWLIRTYPRGAFDRSTPW
ncbi:hypothetical protein NKH18_01785 [Streptomyces sp. M10(2022)]